MRKASGKYPEAFVRQMKRMLEDEAVEFFSALEESPVTSILLNPWKPAAIAFSDMEQLPWNPLGRLVPQRPVFTLDPLFHAGAYYVMEPSSQFIAEIIRQLDLHTRPINALDLCAAPGGKTMLLASTLHPDSLILANEINKSRFRILRHNADKWGLARIAASSLDPSAIPFENAFDLVLVDAPCSGEGLFRKEPTAIHTWSPDQIHHCSLRQQRILKEARRLLKPGGYLIYSTCTFNHSENIGQAALMVQTGMESIPLDLPRAWRLREVVKSNATGYQFFPHLTTGEGFFCSVLKEQNSLDQQYRTPKAKRLPRKNDNRWRAFLETGRTLRMTTDNRGHWYAIPEHLEQRLPFLKSWAPGYRPGIRLGQIKGQHLVPAHALAMSVIRSNKIPVLQLSRAEALSYLRRNPPQAVTTQKAWLIATYAGLALGWIKATGRKLKNYYPVAHRIRMT